MLLLLLHGFCCCMASVAACRGDPVSRPADGPGASTQLLLHVVLLLLLLLLPDVS
jgi:hypothetical protein